MAKTVLVTGASAGIGKQQQFFWQKTATTFMVLHAE